MEIFDSHAHYDDPAFDGDRQSLLASLPAAGVTGIINAGTSVRSSLAGAALAAAYPFIRFAAGIHPEEAQNAAETDLSAIADIAGSTPGAAAIGEIGLDYHFADCPREVQQFYFQRQLALSLELDLPVIVHDREAHADTLRLLKKYRPRGVVHCFSGSAEMAAELLALGFYIGFTGVITFKNNKKAAGVVAAVPLDRLLVETDCPYMAPEPLRGRRSDSSMIAHTLEKIALFKGISPEQAGFAAAHNARELFRIV